jgi:hypothetical protein
MPTFSCLFFALAGCLAQSESNPPRPVELLSRSEVARLMMETDSDSWSKERWPRLLNDPNAYVLMLIDILERNPDHQQLPTNVCGMLATTTAHRAEAQKAVRGVMKKYLKATKPEFWQGVSLGAAAATLGEIGDASDLPEMLLVLRREESIARNLALEGLAKLGDDNTVREIEEIMEAWAGKSTPLDVRKDTTYAKAFEVIGKIKHRLSLKRIAAPD